MMVSRVAEQCVNRMGLEARASRIGGHIMKTLIMNCAVMFVLLASNATADAEINVGQELFKDEMTGFPEIVVNHDGPTDENGCHPDDDGVIHCH